MPYTNALSRCGRRWKVCVLPKKKFFRTVSNAALLSELFGGATSTPALGYWMSPAAGLVAEATTVVFAYAADAALQEHVGRVVELCEELKREMGQEAIALEINGEMYFI